MMNLKSRETIPAGDSIVSRRTESTACPFLTDTQPSQPSSAARATAAVLLGVSSFLSRFFK